MSNLELNTLKTSELLVDKNYAPQAERLIIYYELYKLVRNLNGSILKCGINNDESFGYFSFFKKNNQYNPNQPLVVFEKSTSLFESTLVDKETRIAVKSAGMHALTQQNLLQRSQAEGIEFVTGNLIDALPNYIINNPELKIALLVIDLDNYEHTLSTLQYLYPRLVSNGIIIINNYYKKEAENQAVKDYFLNENIAIRHFSHQSNVYYIIKD
ncbi:MAG: TylF/MycF family methyltransferase [Chitinophagales bacterium]|nr:TylF/MycF family methyltransferase [Chitinophagales bacterium]